MITGTLMLDVEFEVNNDAEMKSIIEQINNLTKTIVGVIDCQMVDKDIKDDSVQPEDESD